MAYRRLKDLREDHDLTQAELAGILNISQRGYSHYETGNNDIPTEILISLHITIMSVYIIYWSVLIKKNIKKRLFCPIN